MCFDITFKNCKKSAFLKKKNHGICENEYNKNMLKVNCARLYLLENVLIIGNPNQLTCFTTNKNVPFFAS